MRIYLPMTLPQLHEAAAAKALPPVPIAGTAVTPLLREMHLGDTDELEYLAQRMAARACLDLLARDPALPPRRVVLAVDAPESQLRCDVDGEPGAVSLTAAVAWSAVAAGLVDDASAEQAVAAAAAASAAAEAGDEDARWLLDETEDYELSWYASQELADVR